MALSATKPSTPDPAIQLFSEWVGSRTARGPLEETQLLVLERLKALRVEVFKLRKFQRRCQSSVDALYVYLDPVLSIFDHLWSSHVHQDKVNEKPLVG
ncbi:MAG: hypothetical protein Q9188_006580 [Gyalolechia gomerana]